MKILKLISVIFILPCVFYDCTKLHETVGGNLTPGQVANDANSASKLLKAAYLSLNYTFTSMLEIFPLSECSTDEAILPTRGPDWDDNGRWRSFHEQTWDADNLAIHDCFNSLSGVVFAATDILNYNPTASQKSEARFLRAWAMYWQFDLFNQVPYRDPGESVVQPARVLTGMVAFNYIVNEVNAVMTDLDEGPANKANKNAARALLMKCYLNKAVYENRAGFSSFDAADMNKVISLADSIINTNSFSFSKNYFDNFSPLNATLSKENIFTQASSSNQNYQTQNFWFYCLMYCAYGGDIGFAGVNGFTSLSDFYDKFDTTDKRWKAVYDYPGSLPNPGRRVNLGFLIDQQYDLGNDMPLSSPNTGLPVIFARDVQNILLGPNLEDPGIRAIKYAPDIANYYGPAVSNDFVYLRLPDVLLMKAEAIWRGGNPTDAGSYGNSPLSLINSIRTNSSRGVAALTEVNPDIILDERGRELWWENWRRQDMVRFKKFLIPFQEKKYDSDPKYLLFPIPNEQKAVNPNLKQNPGY